MIFNHAPKEEDTQTATLKDITDTLASLPEEVVTQVSVETAMAHESSSEEYKKKLEYLMREEEAIKQEAKDTRREKTIESEAYMKEKMRLYLSGPQFSERFWANVRGRCVARVGSERRRERKRRWTNIYKACNIPKGSGECEKINDFALASTAASHAAAAATAATATAAKKEVIPTKEASSADVAKMEMVSEDATKPWSLSSACR